MDRAAARPRPPVAAEQLGPVERPAGEVAERVGDPQLDLGDLPEKEGEPLTFSIEVGVRPTAQLGTYEGIEVGRREPHVDEADVDAELEQLRERAARLETAERAAQRGDFVV